MNNEILVKVEGVSKKFCRHLKRSLWYGSAGASVSLVPPLIKMSESLIYRIKGWHGLTGHKKRKPKQTRHSDEAEGLTMKTQTQTNRHSDEAESLTMKTQHQNLPSL